MIVGYVSVLSVSRPESAVGHVIAFLKATNANVEKPVEARVTLLENEVQEGLVHKLTNSWPTLQRLKDTVKNESVAT